MTDVKTCLSEAQDKMDMATMYLEESLAHIRAGKADDNAEGLENE